MYEKKFKGRIYSDVDVVLFVENNFSIPKDWKEHFIGKIYQVYERMDLENKYQIQYIVVKKEKYEDEKCQEIADKWEVPLNLKNSKNKYEIVYEK